MFINKLSYTFIGLFSVLCTCFIQANSDLDTVMYSGSNTRAQSLGNAFAAIANGASALHYNPAGLSLLNGGIDFQQLDIKQHQFNSASSFGIKIPSFAFSKTVFNTASDSTNIYSFGIGSRKFRPLNWGLKYKHITGSLTDGWAADFGILAKMTPFMNLGFSAQNFISNLDISPQQRLGYSLFTHEKRLLFTQDFTLKNPEDSKRQLRIHTGLEYHLAQELALRIGYSEDSWRLGFGVLYDYFSFDYGTIFKNNDEQQHLLGLNLGFLKEPMTKSYYSLFKPHHYAYLQLSGNLTSGQSEYSLLGGQKIGSNDVLSMIKKAAQDKHCKGFIIRISGFSSSLSAISLIQELRTELKKAKILGKEILIYIDHWAGMSEYYLASIADRIMMPELGTLSHLGLQIDIKKTHEFLQKFGIRPHVQSQGAFKTHMHSQSGPINESERQQLQDLLQLMYMQLTYDIQEDRKVSWETISTYFDGRLISASEAKKVGLIDDLIYWPEVPSLIFPTYEKDRQAIFLRPLLSYQDLIGPQSFIDFSSYIGVIEVDGFMQQGESTSNFLFGQKSTGADDFDDFIDHIIQNNRFKALVLRVNSGGGSMLAADQMYRAIKRLKQADKVVYTSMGNVAASGGYYVALASDKIFANPNTLTGSIGVMNSYLEFSELYKKLGISHESLKTGPYMDLFSSTSETPDEHLDMIKQHQQLYYDRFSDLVMKERHLSPDEVFSVAQGQIFSGKQAQQLKLVDELGNFHDTLDSLAKNHKLDSDKIIFIRKPSKKTFSISDILSLFMF